MSGLAVPSEGKGAPLTGQQFETLFKAEYARLVGVLSALGGDRQVAEDLVQEAFVRAYRGWDRVSQYDDPAGWVRRVAVNCLRSHRRSLQRRLRRLLSHNGVPASDDRGVKGSPSLGVAEALRRLPTRQGQAAALFYVAGYTGREVSDVMGVSEGTVKQHLSRARVALRAALEEPE